MIHPIFLSHSSHDKELAEAIKEEIEKELGNDVVFLSPKIGSGKDWFEKVDESLQHCKIMIILLTKPASDSVWVGFEAGFVWGRLKANEKIHILFHPNAKSIPNPINIIQGQDVTDSEALERFFQELCKQFGKKSFESNANIYRITSLANSSIPPSPDRSLAKFDEYLKDSKEWEMIEDEEIVSWIYTKDVLYQITTNTDEDEPVDNLGKWDFKPNEEKPTKVSVVRLKIAGITIQRIDFARSGGGWFFVPFPEFEFIDEEEIYYWDEEERYFKVGLIIGSTIPTSQKKDKHTLYDFAEWRKIQIR